MSSPVSICNLTLGWLGKNRITALDETSRESSLCKDNYPVARDAALADSVLSFSKARFELVRSLDPPISGYAHKFLLPPEVLKVISINDRAFVGDQPYDKDWAIEGRYLMLNEGTAKISAVTRVTNTDLFSPAFVLCVAARLGIMLAGPLTQSQTREQAMDTKYFAYLTEAKRSDGMQGKSKRLRSNWLRKGRFGGGGYAGPEV